MASIVHLNQRLAASEQPAAGSWLAALEGDDAPGRDRSAARGLVQRLAGELAGHATTIASAVARRMLAAEARLSDPDDPYSPHPRHSLPRGTTLRLSSLPQRAYPHEP